MIYQRNLKTKITKGLRFSPIVLLVGPRQCGKTTLSKQLGNEQEMEFISFDEVSMLALAQFDPSGFVQGLKKPIILDEVQRIPSLFLPIKQDVDSHGLKGQYLLTGSANPLVVPSLGDALTGRMAIYHLWPLSQGELCNKREDFIQTIFSKDFTYSMVPTHCDKEEILNRAMKGGFPRIQQAADEEERRTLCDSYLSSMLQKDIQDLARIEGLAHLPSLLYTLASRTGSTINLADIGRTVSTPTTTLRRYMHLLHSLFLLYTLPPWSKNFSKRLVKAPKIYLSDTAFLLNILHFNRQQLLDNPTILGGVIENFSLMELVKQSSWSEVSIKFYHFKANNAAEVDIVLEDLSGNIVGLEVKAKNTVSPNDFRGLELLKEAAGRKFLRGVVLYTGERILPAKSDMYAIPITKLWDD